MSRTILIVVALFFVNACVYYPTTDKRYHNCTIITKKLTLDHTDLHVTPHSCKDEECLGQLIIIAGVPATTFVVSGSIVVVGNVLHWMEKEGTCEDGFVRTSLTGFLEMLDNKPADAQTDAETESHIDANTEQ